MPDGCGNAPRVRIVADILTHWARGEAQELTPWLGADFRWTRIDAAGEHELAVRHAVPTEAPDSLEFLTIITHGPTAACDGVLTYDGAVVGFSHVVRFAGAGKSAPVVRIRSYGPPWARPTGQGVYSR